MSWITLIILCLIVALWFTKSYAADLERQKRDLELQLESDAACIRPERGLGASASAFDRRDLSCICCANKKGINNGNV